MNKDNEMVKKAISLNKNRLEEKKVEAVANLLNRIESSENNIKNYEIEIFSIENMSLEELSIFSRISPGLNTCGSSSKNF